jgi:hypothetical protein
MSGGCPRRERKRNHRRAWSANALSPLPEEVFSGEMGWRTALRWGLLQARCPTNLDLDHHPRMKNEVQVLGQDR